MSLTIRRLSALDLEAVERVSHACFEHDGERPEFEDELERPYARCLLAHDASGECIGYALGWHLGDVLDVISVGVLPRARKQGVGAALMRALMREASEAEAKSLCLDVRASNAAAIALYAKLGFTAVGKRRAYYRDGEDALTMQRDLVATALRR